MNNDAPISFKDYRSPLVAALGIIVGFLLGFLGQWVTEETFALKGAGDVLTFIGSIAGIVLLIVALYRILLPRDPSKETAGAYLRILRLGVLGVALPLACILASAFL